MINNLFVTEEIYLFALIEITLRLAENLQQIINLLQILQSNFLRQPKMNIDKKHINIL